MTRCTVACEPYPCWEEDGHDLPHRALLGKEVTEPVPDEQVDAYLDERVGAVLEPGAGCRVLP